MLYPNGGSVWNMTDYELMLFRFNRKNIRKSTGAIAKELGMDREIFEEAVERGLKEENKKEEKNDIQRIKT